MPAWVDRRFQRFKAFRAGLHFRFLFLVAGIAGALLCAQLVTDTIREMRETREIRLAQATGVTTIIARSLEKQFDRIELSDIEEILETVRKRENVSAVTVVDRDLTFLLDGDPKTSPIMKFGFSEVQLRSLKSGKTETEASGNLIKVGEPLLSGGIPIGSVMVEFENPGFYQTLIPVIGGKLTTIIPILLTGMLFAVGLVSQITRPLFRLTAMAKAVSDGDLEQEAKVEGAAEIRQLALSFNTMVGTIRENIERIYELAYVDRITQLPNREYFRNELTRAIKRAKRANTSGALLFVDLDGFKRVNDTLGHDLGDKLLAKFAERISGLIRADDTIAWQASEEEGMGANGESKPKEKQVLARLGGDEFTILLAEIREETDAAHVARRIIEAMNEPFQLGATEVRLGASVGIATFPRDGSTYQTILKSADMAMYLAKEEGKNTYRYFSEELNERATKRMEIETDLRKALDRNELELYFQPKFDSASGRPNSVEALVRWNHPERGMVQPGEFIPIAEETGLVRPLGNWVLKRACEQLRIFAQNGIDITIAVNISMQQFERANFSDKVLQIVKDRGIDPKKLELEITESMAMSDPERTLAHIRKLKRVGIRFAIDDFGTGHSNLSQLSRIPFDVFKIDRSFVSELAAGRDPHGEVIIRTILAMARSLGMETVAEGVETEEQCKFLVSEGCSHLQGYLFARPMPAAKLMEWLETHGPQSAARIGGKRKTMATRAA